MKKLVVIEKTGCTFFLTRLQDVTADIEYDDGYYDCCVSLQNLRHIGVQSKRKFTVKHLDAPEAIVLSMYHAHEAIIHARVLVQIINDQLKQSSSSLSISSTSISITQHSSDDEVAFVGKGFSATRGTIERPIII